MKGFYTKGDCRLVMAKFIKKGRYFFITISSGHVSIYSAEIDDEFNPIPSTYRYSKVELENYFIESGSFHVIMDPLLNTHFLENYLNEKSIRDGKLVYDKETVKNFKDIGDESILDILNDKRYMNIAINKDDTLQINVRGYDNKTDEFIIGIKVLTLTDTSEENEISLRVTKLPDITDANKLALLYHVGHTVHTSYGLFNEKLTSILWKFINTKCEHNSTYDKVTTETVLNDFLAKTEELFDIAFSKGEIKE